MNIFLEKVAAEREEKDILLVRQKHQADKAGLHYDWRVVLGDVAYSWSTKKEAPNQGEKLILWEQPTHDKQYSLTKKIIIPKGQYGAGTVTLDYAQKGKAIIGNDYYKLSLGNGESFTIKKLPKYGEKAWMLIRTK